MTKAKLHDYLRYFAMIEIKLELAVHKCGRGDHSIFAQLRGLYDALLNRP